MPKRIEIEYNVCPVCETRFQVGGRGNPGRHQVCCSQRCAYQARYRRGSTANALTERDAAYIAGFIDADGYFMLHGRVDHGSISFRIGAAGTKPQTIEWLPEVTGVGSSTVRKSHNPRHADGWQWTCNGDAALSLAVQLLPFLRVKREQCEMGIEFQERIRRPDLKADRSWQEEWRQRMLALNAKGRG